MDKSKINKLYKTAASINLYVCLCKPHKKKLCRMLKEMRALIDLLLNDVSS